MFSGNILINKPLIPFLLIIYYDTYHYYNVYDTVSLCIASESYTSMRAPIYDVSLSFSLRLSLEEINVVRKLRKALASTFEIPAVYIHFGKQIPAYLVYSVEMTATNNEWVHMSLISIHDFLGAGLD